MSAMESPLGCGFLIEDFEPRDQWPRKSHIVLDECLVLNSFFGERVPDRIEFRVDIRHFRLKDLLSDQMLAHLHVAVRMGYATRLCCWVLAPDRQRFFKRMQHRVKDEVHA